VMAHRSKVLGGWSHMARLYLENQLIHGMGLATAGVAVNVCGKHVMLFATLSNVLADGEGHAKFWGWKGASGLKPCLKHTNVLKKACRCIICTKRSALGSPVQRSNRCGLGWLSRLAS
jgi:hypothetical protein